MSLLGEMQLNRAYYHCAACHCGQVPWDLRLAMGHRNLTPAAEEITTLAGTLDSFAQASERTLVKLAGLRLSESTVERTTEEAGLRLREVRRQRVRLGQGAATAHVSPARDQEIVGHIRPEGIVRLHAGSGILVLKTHGDGAV